jgi:hypothetical protein
MGSFQPILLKNSPNKMGVLNACNFRSRRIPESKFWRQKASESNCRERAPLILET